MTSSTSTPRKTPQANPTDAKHIYNKIKRTSIWYCGGGSMVVWQFMSSQNIYFLSFAGDSIYFYPTSSKTIYFKIWPIWIWLMQDYLFIFLGTQARIFVFRCLTARIFILKNCPPPINCTSPNKQKGDQFQPSPHSTDCHTIPMLHGLWHSIIG